MLINNFLQKKKERLSAKKGMHSTGRGIPFQEGVTITGAGIPRPHRSKGKPCGCGHSVDSVPLFRRQETFS